MRRILNKIKSAMSASDDDDEFMANEADEGYVELDTEAEEVKSKVVVRPFIIENFEDIKLILDDLREGHTISIINIKPLKDKDLVELKRAINKLKKTCDAIEGEIAGFGEDYIIVTPSFARIHRSKQTSKISKEEEVKE